MRAVVLLTESDRPGVTSQELRERINGAIAFVVSDTPAERTSIIVETLGGDGRWTEGAPFVTADFAVASVDAFGIRVRLATNAELPARVTVRLPA